MNKEILKKIIPFKKFIKNDLKRQNGQVAVFVGIALVALVGMLSYVIDEGIIYESRRSFQTVADSAALAGAQELPENPSAAIQAAIDYAEMHEAALSESDISISSTYTSDDTIMVTSSDSTKPLVFAGVFGKNSTPVGADATAVVGSPAEYNNVVPIGILEDDWAPGEEYILKWGPQEDGHNHGNFGPLSLGGTGADNYRDKLREGYSGSLCVGDVVETEPGNMMGPTVTGVGDRINDYPDYNFNDFDELTTFDGSIYKLLESLDSQYVMCPIIDWVPFGRHEVTILGFVPFIITKVQGSKVYGTFIDKALIVTEGEITAASEYGIHVIRLVD